MPKRKWAGRKTKMTKETVEKLEMAFMNSFTDAEACLYAWIDPWTLYNYIKVHPEFSSKKEALKNKPSMKAKLNMVKRINSWNDKESDKRWLERKNKEEFSSKQEVEQKWKIELELEIDLSNKTMKELAQIRKDLLAD